MLKFYWLPRLLRRRPKMPQTRHADAPIFAAPAINVSMPLRDMKTLSFGLITPATITAHSRHSDAAGTIRRMPRADDWPRARRLRLRRRPKSLPGLLFATRPKDVAATRVATPCRRSPCRHLFVPCHVRSSMLLKIGNAEKCTAKRCKRKRR